MAKKILSKLLLLIILISSFLFIAKYTLAADLAEPAKVTLEVPIFQYAESSDLAEYIKTMYQYALYALVPIAMVMIIWAGFMWILAGGDQARIKRAKTYITSALAGIIIALLSYVILSFIGITELKMTGLEYIDPEKIFDDDLYFNKPPLPANSLGGPPAGPSLAPNLPAGTLCFPVARDSYSGESEDKFMASRDGGGRYHAGYDLKTKKPGLGVAVADGVVKLTNKTYVPAGGCTRGWYADETRPNYEPAGKILIYHPSLGYSITYGEISIKDIRVKAGDNVKAGQILGTFGPCRMVHFELYKGPVSNTTPWYVRDGTTPPDSLLNPNSFVDGLRGKWCQ